jgi:hypothetical protein
MKLIALLLSICVACQAHAQNKTVTQPKEILIIGTFHFENPGADLAKTDKFNVMTPAVQQELETITNKIGKFGADKYFVEWPYNRQNKLDTLYQQYKDNSLFAYLQKTVKDTSERENEIYQLAFRAAKKSKTSKVYGIDVNMGLPFDSMMVAIEKAGQTALKNEIFARLKILETEENARRKKFTLTQLLLMNNTPEYRKANYAAYVTLFNRAGALNNFKGADVVNIWYKRNLYMYSLVQKLTESKDKRVVVVLGSGHIALFKQLIDLDENFKVIELKEILNK